VPDYNDGTSSTFGSANRWSANTMVQDFSALRPFVPNVPALSGRGIAALVGLLAVSALWLGRRRGSSG